VKSMEDVMVLYDGTVRNAVGEVLQFCYGEDGMDGSRVEGQAMPWIWGPDAAFRRHFWMPLGNSAERARWDPSPLVRERASGAGRG